MSLKLFRFAFLGLFLTLFCQAQEVRYDGVVQQRSGLPGPGVTIAVCTQPAVTTTTPCSPLATLYTNSGGGTVCSGTLLPPAPPGSACSNPMIADGLGNYHFYAAPGQYTLQFYGFGVTPYIIQDFNITCSVGFSCTITGPLNANGGISTNKVNNIVYIDGTVNTTLAAYLAAPSANTTVVVPSNQTISSDIIISVAGLKITCENGATLTYTTAGRLQFQGDRSGIEGCKLIGPGSGTSGLEAALFTGTNQFFRRNYYGAFGSTAGNGDVTVSAGASHFSFTDNVEYAADGDFSFYVNNCCTANATMTDIRVENNDIGEFIAHATTAGTVINGIASVGNHFHAAQASKIEFCEEIGVFGGSSVLNVTSIGNKCQLTASGGDGGYSFASVVNYTESGDQFYANGFQYTICGSENVATQSGSLTGNLFATGSQSTGVCGIDVNPNGSGNTDISVNSNIIVGSPASPSQAFSGIYVGTVNALSLKNINVSGNIVDITGATGKSAAIWVQANNAGANVSNVHVTGNLLYGPGNAGDNGIVFERDTGTMVHNVVGPNHVFNFNTPYSSNANSPSAGFAAGTVDSVQSGQVVASAGVPCTNGELALSAGWQSTGSATVTAVAGNGQTCSWTITTGTTTAANPTVTDTLTNTLPTATTVCELNIHGGTHTAAAGEGFQQTTLSATAPVFTFNGTPTAGGTTYFVTRRCGP